jgi:phospholipid transport system transporter-binding protein|tara:strand:+ start:47797 stop:48147 length:351 start_codon:yes stop_codon:yes gene_type:complete
MTRLFDEHDVCLEAAEGQLAVSGDVDFDVAAPLAAAGAKWIADQPVTDALQFDLRGVDRVSSAALSVMLEWLRSAQRAGIEVAGVQLSPALAKLTALAGLDSLLPQADVHRVAAAD